MEVVSPTPSDLPLSMCYNVPPIDHCIRYSQSFTTASTGSLACAECQADYFLNASRLNYQCNLRQADYTNCAEREISQDLCKTCDPQYFLNSTKDKCITYPTGFYGCI